jgi:hypothetical protein
LLIHRVAAWSEGVQVHRMRTPSMMLVLACLFGACSSSSPARSPESPRDELDGGPDGRVPDGRVVEPPVEAGTTIEAGTSIEAGIPSEGGPQPVSCDARWADVDVLEARATCTSGSDCVLLGGCSFAAWNTVAARDEAEGRRLYRELDLAGCGGGFDGPIPGVECVAGMCQTTDWVDECGGWQEDGGFDDAGE